MKARIAEKQEVAKGTLQVTYDLLGNEVSFEPGQFFFVRLVNPPYEDERGSRRHFSIVNSPNEKGVLIMATRLRDSAFKRSLRDMQLGSGVEVGPIAGDFTLPADASRPLVFIAGGIGITPFIAMIRYVREENLGHAITLLYANRDRESAAYLEELQQHADEMPNFALVPTMSRQPDWPGETRMIDARFVKDYIRDPNSCLYMIAGPPGMDEALDDALTEAGVDGENIIIERFTGY